jgi:hypothetical protein
MGSAGRMLIRTVRAQWWMGFIVLAMLVVGCAEGDMSNVDESKSTGVESSPTTETDTKEQPAPTATSVPEAGQLVLVEWDFETDDGLNYVVGIVENNTASDYEFVTIVFGTYDADGFKIGETGDSAALRAGEKWKFKAMIFEDNAATVKAISLDGM